MMRVRPHMHAKSGLRMGTVTLMAALLVLALSACTAGPRFSADEQYALRTGDMQRLSTDTAILYYPRARRAEAVRVADAVETCAMHVEELLPHGRATETPLIVILAELESDGPRVQPGVADDGPYLLIPLHITDASLIEDGWLPDPAHLACRHTIDLIRAMEIRALHGALHRVFGGSLNPQIGFSTWYQHGLAIQQDALINPGMGPLHSPSFRNRFHAAISSMDLDGGRLHEADPIIADGDELAGAHFVQWLAHEYGDDALWQTVHRQSRAALPLLGVSGRFANTMEAPLPDLFARWREEVTERLPTRAIPPDQDTLRPLARDALLVRAPSGHIAFIDEDLERPPRLEILGPDGRTLLRRTFPDVLAPRTFAESAPHGMAFSEDGQHLHLLVRDRGPITQRTDLVRLDVATGRTRRIATNLRARDGDVRIHNDTWLFSRADGNRTELVRLDLSTGEFEVLLRTPSGAHLARPRAAPDGTTIAAIHLSAGARSLLLVDADGSNARELGTSAFPDWPNWHDHDADTLYYSALAPNGSVQLFGWDRATRRHDQLTSAPWIASQPFASHEGVHFLSLNGVTWSLDLQRAEHARTHAAEQPPDPPFESLKPPTDLRLLRPDVLHPPTTYSLGSPLASGLSTGQPVAALVHDDRPYRRTEGLFLPRLRAGYLLYTGLHFAAGATMQGRDQLGFHNWAAFAEIASYENWRVPWEISYLFTGLAPWSMSLSGGDQWTTATVITEDSSGDEQDADLRSRGVDLTFERPFRMTTLGFSAILTQRTGFTDRTLELPTETAQDTNATPTELASDALLARHLITGLRTHHKFLSGRSAPRRGDAPAVGWELTAGAFAAHDEFDRPWGDLRGSLFSRIALWPRTRLRLAATGRSLQGHSPVPFVAGGQRSGAFAVRMDSTEPNDRSDFSHLRSIELQEPVRGFEDFGVLAQHAAHAEASLTLRIPVETGSIATGRILPAVYLPWVELSAFSTALTTFREDEAISVGGDIRMLLHFGAFQTHLGWQLSYRPGELGGWLTVFDFQAATF